MASKKSSKGSGQPKLAPKATAQNGSSEGGVMRAVAGFMNKKDDLLKSIGRVSKPKSDSSLSERLKRSKKPAAQPSATENLPVLPKGPKSMQKKGENGKQIAKADQAGHENGKSNRSKPRQDSTNGKSRSRSRSRKKRQEEEVVLSVAHVPEGNQFDVLGNAVGHQEVVEADLSDDSHKSVNGALETAVVAAETTGFIGFDDEFSDAAESIHTTFRAFEEEALVADDDDDYSENEQADVSINSETSASSRRKRAYDEVEDAKSAKLTKSAEFPWVVNHDHSDEKEIADWLTMEIKDFVAYMAPSSTEVAARKEAVRRVRALVSDLWHDADAHVFGSFATDLYLPGSDIDMVVISKSGRYDSRQALYQLSSKLRASGMAKRMEVIAKARVPIIKFVETSSNIHIDISFERLNGLDAVKVIQSWTKNYPSLRYLAVVIKQFLARRRLNEVHTGGLGGFSIICLIVSFLNNHPKVSTNSIDPLDNLGVLLIEFFELYGRSFNYDMLALCMTDTMGYLRKSDHTDLKTNNSFALAIQDPNDESNNLSRGSFNTRALKKAFSGAFDMLVARCYELEYASFRDRVGRSLLGHVIKFRGPQRDFEDSTGTVTPSDFTSEYEIINAAHRDPPVDMIKAVTEELLDSDDSEVKKGSAAFLYDASDSDSDVEVISGRQGSPPAPIYLDSDSADESKPVQGSDIALKASPKAEEDSDSRTASIRKRDYWLSKGQVL